MSSLTVDDAFIAGIFALVINVLALVSLITVLCYLAWSANRMKRREFATVAIKLIKTRSRMKKSRLSLEEFLHLCNILGITRNEIRDIYNDMHKRRREMGESWLFETVLEQRGQTETSLVVALKPIRPQSTSTGTCDWRRQIPIFQSFASMSQFTQGYEGFRMHRLLHISRPSDYQTDDSPEMNTYYQVSEICTTMRKPYEADPPPEGRRTSGQCSK